MAASNTGRYCTEGIQENDQKTEVTREKTHKTDQERLWNNTYWINRRRDIQSQRYLKTAKSNQF